MWPRVLGYTFCLNLYVQFRRCIFQLFCSLFARKLLTAFTFPPLLPLTSSLSPLTATLHPTSSTMYHSTPSSISLQKLQLLFISFPPDKNPFLHFSTSSPQSYSHFHVIPFSSPASSFYHLPLSLHLPITASCPIIPTISPQPSFFLPFTSTSYLQSSLSSPPHDPSLYSPLYPHTPFIFLPHLHLHQHLHHTSLFPLQHPAKEKELMYSVIL